MTKPKLLIPIGIWFCIGVMSTVFNIIRSIGESSSAVSRILALALLVIAIFLVVKFFRFETTASILVGIYFIAMLLFGAFLSFMRLVQLDRPELIWMPFIGTLLQRLCSYWVLRKSTIEASGKYQNQRNTQKLLRS